MAIQVLTLNHQKLQSHLRVALECLGQHWDLLDLQFKNRLLDLLMAQ